MRGAEYQNRYTVHLTDDGGNTWCDAERMKGQDPYLRIYPLLWAGECGLVPHGYIDTFIETKMSDPNKLVGRLVKIAGKMGVITHSEYLEEHDLYLSQ